MNGSSITFIISNLLSGMTMRIETVYCDQWWSNKQIMRFLYEIKTGKTWQGRRQEGGRVRQREIFGERGRATQRREEMAWVDFDRWSKSTTSENFLKVSINNNNRRIRRQSSFWEALNFLRLIWLYIIRSNNTESTTLCIFNELFTCP